MQIRKKWLNQLKNVLKNILKNNIWHLFPVESHAVVKITVPKYLYDTRAKADVRIRTHGSISASLSIT
jgi:hypothetical protein